MQKCRKLESLWDSGRGEARPVPAGGQKQTAGQHEVGQCLSWAPAPALRELAGRSLILLPQAALSPARDLGDFFGRGPEKVT